MMLLQYYFLIFFIKTYVVGTRLNCLDLSRQFYKNICCGYSFELPRLVEAIQMSSHNIRFNKEVDKSTLAVI